MSTYWPLKTTMESIDDSLSSYLSHQLDIKSKLNESEHSPVAIKYDVCYIVAAVIIKHDHIMMIRESKKSCYGKWYLPAGRVEKNESLEQAVKREVKEEAGIDINVCSLMCIEPKRCWFRFSFAGECVGGQLKDSTQEDKHSIEAKWIPVDDVLHYWDSGLILRETDILKLVSLAVPWYRTMKPIKESHLLPSLRSHSICLLRIYLVSKQDEGLFLFVGHDKRVLIECVMNNQQLDIYQLIRLTLKVSGFDGSLDLHGVLSVEHTGDSKENGDGFLLAVLAESRSGTTSPNSLWTRIQDGELSRRLAGLMEDSLCPALV